MYVKILESAKAKEAENLVNDFVNEHIHDYEVVNITVETVKNAVQRYYIAVVTYNVKNIDYDLETEADKDLIDRLQDFDTPHYYDAVDFIDTGRK